LPDIKSLILLIPPILAALTVHEYAHGLVAYRLGDPTAKYQGRLTLNPIAHLDPLGTILLFIAYFGWAKPVPVNPFNFRNPRTDMIWVALAGPASNVLLAMLMGIVLQPLIAARLIEPYGPLYQMITMGVFINLMLAFFNLIPIPPLDGSKIVSGLLPLQHLHIWENFERIGPFVLLGAILIGRLLNIPIFGATIYPVSRFLYRLFTGGALLIS
jgi:Zn-dependent protease